VSFTGFYIVWKKSGKCTAELPPENYLSQLILGAKWVYKTFLYDNVLMLISKSTRKIPQAAAKASGLITAYPFEQAPINDRVR
jgi:hypothetical protein